MAEKHTPATIWACMEGPMVGLFVSGGYTAGWPKYVRADSHDKLVEALEAIASVDDDGFTSDGHERCSEAASRALASLQTQEAGDA